MKTILVTVKPHSKKGPLIEPVDDIKLIIYVREVAADGKANEAVVTQIAKYYKVPKSHISIVRGHTSRHKLIAIE